MNNSSSKKSNVYGYFNGSYFRVPKDMPNVYVPEDADYTNSSIMSQVDSSIKQCYVNMYEYTTSIIDKCNSLRVAFMKEYLIGEKITEIEDINLDYILTVGYNLYNNKGEIISSGAMSVVAKPAFAVISDAVREDNSMEYRKAIVLDSNLELQIPMISRYGIKKQYVQSPYILEITDVTAETTIGDRRFITESNTQNMHDKHHKIHRASHCNYHFCRPDHMLFNDFASNFVTNARVGTTIIDQAVLPVELQVPPECRKVQLANIKYEDKSHIIKINEAVETIVINLETIIDNLNIVYNNKDIDGVLRYNEDVDDDHVLDIPSGDDSNDSCDCSGSTEIIF